MDKYQLYKFFAGESNMEDEIAIREWLEESAQNKKEFFRERKLFDASYLNTGRIPPVKSKHIYFNFRKIGYVAATIAIIISISIFLNNYSIIDNHAVNTAMNIVTVPAGQRVKLILPDGTIVWLNSQSTFTYPAVFSKTRQVTLNGEGFFEVKADKNSPFIVSTSKGSVNVTGTIFNVRALDNEGIFETTLLEGKVKVISAEDSLNTIDLKPNQKSKFLGNNFTVENIDDHDEFLWRNGLMSFKNRSLDEIVREFEQQYGVNIILNHKNKQLFKHSYTAKFRTTDGLEYNLDILRRTATFKYERSTDNETIYIN
ncbi:MAG: FecR family protein [Paludibacter sp.]|nr:FecR family protein [Paludibacter sp.]